MTGEPVGVIVIGSDSFRFCAHANLVARDPPSLGVSARHLQISSFLPNRSAQEPPPQDSPQKGSNPARQSLRGLPRYDLDGEPFPGEASGPLPARTWAEGPFRRGPGLSAFCRSRAGRYGGSWRSNQWEI